MCSSISKWKKVMNLLRGDGSPGLQAFLTQGVLMDVSVTDSLPRSAVTLLSIRVSLIAVVEVICLWLMLRAIHFTRLCKVRAPGHTTWAFRTPRHQFTSISGHKESR